MCQTACFLYRKTGVSGVVSAIRTLRAVPAVLPAGGTVRRAACERERAAHKLAPPEAVAAPAVAEAAPAEVIYPVAVDAGNKRPSRTGEDRHHNRGPRERGPRERRPARERRPSRSARATRSSRSARAARSSRPAGTARSAWSAGTSKTIWHVKAPFKYTIRDVVYYEHYSRNVQVQLKCMHTFRAGSINMLFRQNGYN